MTLQESTKDSLCFQSVQRTSPFRAVPRTCHWRGIIRYYVLCNLSSRNRLFHCLFVIVQKSSLEVYRLRTILDTRCLAWFRTVLLSPDEAAESARKERTSRERQLSASIVSHSRTILYLVVQGAFRLLCEATQNSMGCKIVPGKSF